MISTNNNLMALHTANTLNSHYGRLSTSVERLSSGLRINSAADDAAGLAIRELMRADIAVFYQGQRNANDAISMIQVADGALAIIDEKLIRMKELAEQAATGTYDSTQRLMIDSEFQAMADEIDRIARATDFNGLKLLDGSLSGTHNGSGLKSSGAMKIHFGSGNDSAEDYYYVEIADCTTSGLGLRRKKKADGADKADQDQIDGSQDTKPQGIPLSLFDCSSQTSPLYTMPGGNNLTDFTTVFQNGRWGKYCGPGGADDYNNFMVTIPQGSKNIVIVQAGQTMSRYPDYTVENDLQLFTMDGKHLAGTPYLNDTVWGANGFHPKFPQSTLIDDQISILPFTEGDYDASFLNEGPDAYLPEATNATWSEYNGMRIAYSGDPERSNYYPNGWYENRFYDYDMLAIDEAKEDLILWFPGAGSGFVKVYWDVADEDFEATFRLPEDPPQETPVEEPEDTFEAVSIETQEKAQKALVTLNNAIVVKDKARAHLGALQNRLENTVSNLSIQAVNLQASESRISDADIAFEMTGFVRNQVLSQSAVAMLGQANAMPQMVMRLLG